MQITVAEHHRRCFSALILVTHMYYLRMYIQMCLLEILKVRRMDLRTHFPDE